MNAITNFIKDIFMITPDTRPVGLSGIKPVKKSSKKTLQKSLKKSEIRLSDLMRKC